VTYADTDIDGHKLNRVFFYVIPGQEDDVILGLPWMQAEEVTISPAQGELTIGTSGLVVKERSRGKEASLSVSHQMSSVFGALVRRARKDHRGSRPRIAPIGEASSKPHQWLQYQLSQRTQIFTASLADIEKALAPKRHSDPRLKLPPQYHEFLPLFDRAEADRLPPSRPGVDHEIQLEKDDDGREKAPP
jgi:hypothetical protein